MSDLNLLLSIQITICLNLCVNQYDMSKIRIKFDGSFLNVFPASIIHGKIVNIYIVYEVTYFHNIDHYLTLRNALFGSVKLTKNAHTDIGKYKYSAYDIGFDGKGYFSIGDELGRNLVIFGENMDSLPFSDNKGKHVLTLGKGPTEGLGEHSLAAEKCIPLILLKLIQNFV